MMERRREDDDAMVMGSDAGCGRQIWIEAMKRKGL